MVGSLRWPLWRPKVQIRGPRRRRNKKPWDYLQIRVCLDRWPYLERRRSRHRNKPLRTHLGNKKKFSFFNERNLWYFAVYDWWRALSTKEPDNIWMMGGYSIFAHSSETISFMFTFADEDVALDVDNVVVGESVHRDLRLCVTFVSVHEDCGNLLLRASK